MCAAWSFAWTIKIDNSADATDSSSQKKIPKLKWTHTRFCVRFKAVEDGHVFVPVYISNVVNLINGWLGWTESVDFKWRRSTEIATAAHFIKSIFPSQQTTWFNKSNLNWALCFVLTGMLNLAAAVLFISDSLFIVIIFLLTSWMWCKIIQIEAWKIITLMWRMELSKLNTAKCVSFLQLNQKRTQFAEQRNRERKQDTKILMANSRQIITNRDINILYHSERYTTKRTHGKIHMPRMEGKWRMKNKLDLSELQLILTMARSPDLVCRKKRNGPRHTYTHSVSKKCIVITQIECALVCFFDVVVWLFTWFPWNRVCTNRQRDNVLFFQPFFFCLHYSVVRSYPIRTLRDAIDNDDDCCEIKAWIVFINIYVYHCIICQVHIQSLA